MKQTRFCKYTACLKKNPLLYGPVKKIKMSGNVQKDTAVCVLGPCMNSFVAWVLHKALKSGCRRLYFLARDGYLMYKTAKMYCEHYRLPVECRYLSCSRYAIRIPMYHLDMEEAIDYIGRGGIDVTFSKILNRAGLDAEEKEKVIKLLHMEKKSGEVIPYAKLEGLKEELSRCVFFTEAVRKHSEAAMPALAGYLKQEGLLDDVKASLVDSGWIGSMQKILNRFLTQMGRREAVDGYYWGLYELPKGADLKDYHCFYFSPERGLRRKVYFSNCLFEVIFSAPHGMTLSYEKKGTEYRPVCGETDRKTKVFIEQTESYLRQYTKELLKRQDSAGQSPMSQNYKGKNDKGQNDKGQSDMAGQKTPWERAADPKTAAGLLKLFMGQPTPEEAKVFGNLTFSDDVLEDEKQETAALMSEEELKANHAANKALVMLGIKKGHIRESAWYEGSAVRSGQHVRGHLFSYRMYKYLLYMRKTYQWRKNNV